MQAQTLFDDPAEKFLMAVERNDPASIDSLLRRQEVNVDQVLKVSIQACVHYTTSLVPSFSSLTVRKSGRGPGIIYHVSDVGVREKGREVLIRRIVDVPTHVVDR